MAISRGQKAGSSLTGGISGAAAGSIFGPLGAGIGGLLGLGAGYLGSDNTTNAIQKKQRQMGNTNGMNAINNMGQDPRIGTYNVLTPEQQQRANWAGNYAQQQLGNNQFSFDPIEKRAREQFQQNTLPGISNAFTTMGSGPESSAYWNAQLGAKGDLESSLAALRSTYGLQQQQLLQNLLGIGQSPQFESYYKPGDENAFNAFGRNVDIPSALGTIKDMWGNYKANKAAQGNESAAQTVRSQFKAPAYQPQTKTGQGLNLLYGYKG